MIMPTSPVQRTTRSNSSPQALTINEVKALIEGCRTEIQTTINEKFDNLVNIIESLVVRVEALEKHHEELLNKVHRLEREQQCMQSSGNNAINVVKRDELLMEVEERQRRRDYLIVFGLLEKGTGSVEERKRRDADSFKSLLQEIGIPDLVPKEVVRIGKVSDTRPRLLRVRCSDFEAKMAILRAARNLRSSKNFKNVYINPDRTRMQREKNGELRRELRERRNAGEKVVIRGDQIVESENNKNFR